MRCICLVVVVLVYTLTGCWLPLRIKVLISLMLLSKSLTFLTFEKLKVAMDGLLDAILQSIHFGQDPPGGSAIAASGLLHLYLPVGLLQLIILLKQQFTQLLILLNKLLRFGASASSLFQLGHIQFELLVFPQPRFAFCELLVQLLVLLLSYHKHTLKKFFSC